MNDYNRLCSLNIQRSLKKFAFTLSLLITSYLAMTIGPFYGFVKFRKQTTVTSFKIPFVAPFSDLEFLINNCIQFAISVVGFPGNIGIEGLFALTHGLNYCCDRVHSMELFQIFEKSWCRTMHAETKKEEFYQNFNDDSNNWRVFMTKHLWSLSNYSLNWIIPMYQDG